MKFHDATDNNKEYDINIELLCEINDFCNKEGLCYFPHVFDEKWRKDFETLFSLRLIEKVISYEERYYEGEMNFCIRLNWMGNDIVKHRNYEDYLQVEVCDYIGYVRQNKFKEQLIRAYLHHIRESRRK